MSWRDHLLWPHRQGVRFRRQFDKRITHIRRFIERCAWSAASSLFCVTGLYQHTRDVYKLPSC